jgi:hypothetical protein
VRYAIIDIGCIECGDDTAYIELVDHPPDGVPILHPGDERRVTYQECRIALAIGPATDKEET